MIVNTKKTKVMVCRRGGRIREKAVWFYNGEKLEVVNEYKYLGFWFSSTGKHGKHIKKMREKAQKTINMAWGVMKRANLNTLGRRKLLMETLAKSGCLYGIELWGWRPWKKIETAQGKIMKMILGVNANTPGYIWRMEAGKQSMEVEARRRVGEYIVKILEMGEDRWPKVCLREEIRGLENRNPTEWVSSWREAMEQVGEGQIWKVLKEDRGKTKLEKKLEEGVKRRAEQEIQLDWNRVANSNYWKYYGRWKKGIGAEKYQNEKGIPTECKEESARIRCGSVCKEGGKSYKDWNCRLCRREEEKLEHIWVCNEARKKIRKEWVVEVDKWRKESRGTELIEKLVELLSGKINLGRCKYARAFEWWAEKA